MLTANCLIVISVIAALQAIDSPRAIAWACLAVGLFLLAWVAEHEVTTARGAK